MACKVSAKSRRSASQRQTNLSHRALLHYGIAGICWHMLAS